MIILYRYCFYSIKFFIFVNNVVIIIYLLFIFLRNFSRLVGKRYIGRYIYWVVFLLWIGRFGFRFYFREYLGKFFYYSVFYFIYLRVDLIIFNFLVRLVVFKFLRSGLWMEYIIFMCIVVWVK